MSVTTNPIVNGDSADSGGAGTTTIFPTLNIQAAASANVATINAALLNRGEIKLVGNGVAWVNANLVIESNTTLWIDPRLTLRMIKGTKKSVIRNRADVTPDWKAISAVAGSIPDSTITVTCPGHGFAVGDWVSVEGIGAMGYNGTFRVQTVADANTFTYRSPLRIDNNAPIGSTGSYSGPEGGPLGRTWTMQVQKSDQNITITGGGEVDFNWVPADGNDIFNPLTTQTYPIVLGYVYSPRVEHIKISNGRKYGISIYNSHGARGRDVRLENNSDGFNIMAPTHNCILEGITGRAGDDLISILCGNPNTATSQQAYSIGDGYDITIIGCHPTTGVEPGELPSLGHVKITGRAPFINDQIRIKSLAGAAKGAGLLLVDDVEMVGMRVGYLEIEFGEAAVLTGASPEIVRVSTSGVCEWIKVKGSVRNSGGSNSHAVSVTRAPTVIVPQPPAPTIRRLEVDLFLTGATLADQSGISINCTSIDRLDLTLNSDSTYGNASATTGACYMTAGTIDTITCTGTMLGLAGVRALYNQSATVNRVIFNGFVTKTIRNQWESEATANSTTTVLANNCHHEGSYQMFLVRRPTTFVLGNISTASVTRIINDTSAVAGLLTATVGEIPAGTALFETNAANTYSIRRSQAQPQAVTFAASMAPHLARGNYITLTTAMTSDITFTAFTAIPPAGEEVTVRLTQDATGGRQVTWPATCKFPVAFTQGAGAGDANKSTVVRFVSDGTNLVAQPNAWYA